MLCILDSVDSTNNEVARNHKNMPHLSAFFAHEQTGGRGRNGRNWKSLKDNVSVSFILKPNQDSQYDKLNTVSNTTFVCALATLKTIENYLTPNTKILCKWPNDILIDKKKVAGILIETDSSNSSINYVIVGIGINVNDNPNNLEYETTSMFNVIQKYMDPIKVAELLRDNLSFYLDILKNEGFAKIIELYRANLYGLKNNITVKLENTIYNGVFEDIDSNGFIVLKCNDGIKKISVGDIFIK